jgi:hypothetical protein
MRHKIIYFGADYGIHQKWMKNGFKAKVFGLNEK